MIREMQTWDLSTLDDLLLLRGMFAESAGNDAFIVTLLYTDETRVVLRSRWSNTTFVCDQNTCRGDWNKVLALLVGFTL